jgi:hypothetical protein
MARANGLEETTGVTAPVASNTPESNTRESNKLSVNVFTAPGKTMVGERPKPFGEAFGFDPMTELYPHWVANQSWLMFGFPRP